MLNQDAEVEQFINGLEENKRTIYRFMEQEFNRLSSSRRQESSDETDEKVARAAAEKFGISIEDAQSLFVDVEMRIAEFQKERRKKQ